MGEDSSGRGNIHTQKNIFHLIEIPEEVMVSDRGDYRWTAFGWLT